MYLINFGKKKVKKKTIVVVWPHNLKVNFFWKQAVQLVGKMILEIGDRRRNRFLVKKEKKMILNKIYFWLTIVNGGVVPKVAKIIKKLF